MHTGDIVEKAILLICSCLRYDLNIYFSFNISRSRVFTDAHVLNIIRKFATNMLHDIILYIFSKMNIASRNLVNIFVLLEVSVSHTIQNIRVARRIFFRARIVRVCSPAKSNRNFRSNFVLPKDISLGSSYELEPALCSYSHRLYKCSKRDVINLNGNDIYILRESF